MLTAYVDETGQESKGLVIVAGFVGDIDAWKECAIQWRAGFEGSQRQSLHLNRLKFKRNSEKELLERLGPIPQRCGLKPVSGSVNVADYSDLVEGSVSEVHAHGYTMAIATLLLAIRTAIPEDERYELIFEDQEALEVYREKNFSFYAHIMNRDPSVKSGAKHNQLVSWRTMTKGQTCLFEPADYLCYYLAHNAADPNSVRSVWTRPIVGDGRVYISHFTREFTRHLFEISPSLRPSSPKELAHIKRAIKAGEYDPWAEYLESKKAEE
jgi:hypothetical protein